MILAIRHFPDRERPCIVLEEGSQGLVLSYLTDEKREKWLRKAIMMENEFQIAIPVYSLYTLDEIMESEESDMSDFEVVNKDAEVDTCYGLETFHITKEEIDALLSGKKLYSTVNGGEYAITIIKTESEEEE